MSGKHAVSGNPTTSGKHAVAGKPAVSGKHAISGKPADSGKLGVSGTPALPGATPRMPQAGATSGWRCGVGVDMNEGQFNYR